MDNSLQADIISALTLLVHETRNTNTALEAITHSLAQIADAVRAQSASGDRSSTEKQ